MLNKLGGISVCAHKPHRYLLNCKSNLGIQQGSMDHRPTWAQDWEGQKIM